jgi:hypothetical protein
MAKPTVVAERAVVAEHAVVAKRTVVAKLTDINELFDFRVIARWALASAVDYRKRVILCLCEVMHMLDSKNCSGALVKG